MKTRLKGKLIRLNAYSEREERLPMNNLTLHRQELEKMNFEKINKTDKYLATLASQKRKGERQRERVRERGRDDSNYEIKNESEDITAEFTEVKKDYKRLLLFFIRDYYEHFYTNKLDNLDDMDKFLETNNLPKVIHEEKKSE